MTTRFLSFIPALVISCMAASPAAAQRTARGERMVTLEMTSRAGDGFSPGGGVSFGRYALGWYACAGAGLVPCGRAGTRERDACRHLTLEGGAMYRLAGSYSRAANLYAGAFLLAGYTTSDVMQGGLITAGDDAAGEPGLFYGLAPALEAELFLTGGTALCAGIRTPFCAGDHSPLRFGAAPHSVMFTVGLRVNFL